MVSYYRFETGSMYDMIWDMSDSFVIVAGLTDLHRIDVSLFSVASEANLDGLPVRALSWNPNAQQFAAVGRAQPFVSFWTASPLNEIHSIQLDAIVNDISYLNETYAAVGMANGKVLIVNPQTGEIAQQINYSDEITAVAWNPVNDIIAACGQTGSDPNQPTSLLEFVVPMANVLATDTPTLTSTPKSTFTSSPTPTSAETATSRLTLTSTPAVTCNATIAADDALSLHCGKQQRYLDGYPLFSCEQHLQLLHSQQRHVEENLTGVKMTNSSGIGFLNDR